MHSDDLRIDTATPIKWVLSPFQRFMRAEASGGIVLLLCTVGALIIANSGLAENYHHILETKIFVGIPGTEFGLDLTVHHWINDWLMAIFFFVVGMEIKRELLVGELASRAKAVLPIMAAVGGMVLPALIYVAFTAGGGSESLRGWGIPMATDIAFVVGVIALLGSRVPLALKVFLTALAIVDDIGAVLVIAVFYTDDLLLTALLIGLGGVGLSMLMNVLGVRTPYVYLAIGGIVWLAFLKSNVHATIAGVLMAFTIPAKVVINQDQFSEKIEYLLKKFRTSKNSSMHIANNQRAQTAIHAIEDTCEKAQPPLQRIEHGLVYWVSFFIVPVFALANAGVHFEESVVAALTSSVAMGIAAGLIIGKTVGVFGFTYLAVRMGLGELPRGATWTQVIGVSALAGIGFTMSLFVAGLAFPPPGGAALLVDAKIGILMGSLIAGVSGFTVLYFSSSKAKASDVADDIDADNAIETVDPQSVIERSQSAA